MYVPEFKQDCVGCLGMEVEYGLFQQSRPAPLSFQFTELIDQDQGKWMMDLPAWQVEYATPPCKKFTNLRDNLETALQKGWRTANMLGCKFRACEVAPDCRDAYISSPGDRYEKITSNTPKKKWGAGCRVAGTHVHYGCKDLEHAIKVHNRLAQKVEYFCDQGVHPPESGPNRLDLYRKMAPVYKPPIYGSVREWKQRAEQEGFDDNLSNCWHFVRISVHGTVEVRCFGITFNLDELISWAEDVKQVAEGG